MTEKEIRKNWIRRELISGNRMTAERISQQCSIYETEDSCPNTRSLIRELIDDGELIGSNNNGYKMMTTAKEVQVYLNSLLKRQLGMSTRIQAVYDAAQLKGIL